VGALEGADVSQAMLDKAEPKFKGKCPLKIGDATNLPYEDNTFDGVVCNQVVQHIDMDTESRPNLSKAYTEMFRVLKPGGIVVMSTRSKEPAYTDLYWYTQLMPKAVAAMCKKVPSREECEEAMVNAGFEHTLSCCPLNQSIVKPDVFTNPEGPFDPAWRRCESFWSIVTPEEMESMQVKLRTMIDAGTVKEFIEAGEKKRKAAGQTLFVCGVKPGAPGPGDSDAA